MSKSMLRRIRDGCKDGRLKRHTDGQSDTRSDGHKTLNVETKLLLLFDSLFVLNYLHDKKYIFL